MSSPMHTRSGISLLPVSTKPQSPYRLAMPATLTTTSTTATTSTSSSTEISSTTSPVVLSTAPAPVISSVSTSSTVSMSTVITSPSTVTSPVASVSSASSASFTAAASTFYLTTDPGIPGPSLRLDENLSVVVKHQNFLERNNQHVVRDTAQSASPPTATALQTTENATSPIDTSSKNTVHIQRISSAISMQGAQQPRTSWNRQNRQPLTSGEQHQCRRCFF